MSQSRPREAPGEAPAKPEAQRLASAYAYVRECGERRRGRAREKKEAS